MKKTALLFAGQGAQAVGMGKELAAEHQVARDYFSKADQVLGYDLSSFCMDGPEEELTKTTHAQPGIFLVSWIALAVLKKQLPELKFEAAAGLSLGEFTALAAAGVFSFEDGLKLIKQRGTFMQEACENTRGGMAAIIGLEEGPTREACEEAGVELANLNCPGQIVISGPADRLEKACELAKAKGAKKAIPLPVAGAYHSSLMLSAKEKLDCALAATQINIPAVPVISNVTAQPHMAPVDIHHRLVDQVTSSVRWEDSMRHLLANGFTRFIELGPGTALSGFMKRIDKTAEILNVGDSPSLQNTLGALRSSV